MRKNLSELILLAGAHTAPEHGGCLMEVVAWWAGEEHSDEPKCVCPVLASYGRRLNDGMPQDQRQRLREFVPLVTGTAQDSGDIRDARMWMAADRAVRVLAPIALDAAGLTDHAARLRGLPPVTKETVDIAAVRGDAATCASDGAPSAFAAAYSATAAAEAAEDAEDAEGSEGAGDDAAMCATLAALEAGATAAHAGAWDEALQLFRDMIALGAENRAPPTLPEDVWVEVPENCGSVR